MRKGWLGGLELGFKYFLILVLSAFFLVLLTDGFSMVFLLFVAGFLVENGSVNTELLGTLGFPLAIYRTVYSF